MSITPIAWSPEILANFGATADINTSVTQTNARIAGLSNGNFVVLWEDPRNNVDGASGRDMIGQIFDPTGARVGRFFKANSFDEDAERNPSVAALSNGGFVVAYIDEDASSSAVRFDILSASGEVIRTGTAAQRFFSGSRDNGRVFDPTVEALEDGNFAITWHDRATGFLSQTDRVMTRIFTETGTSIRTPVVFNLQPDGHDVAARFDDYFLFAAAQASTSSFASSTIRIRALDVNGAAPFAERVLTSATGEQWRDVAIAPVSAGFTNAHVIAWTSNVGSNNPQIKISLFTSFGTLVSQRAITPSSVFASQPDVIRLSDDGGFFVVWDNRTADRIEGLRFTASGVQVGTVRTIASGGVDLPELSETSDGRILATWVQSGDIRTRILDPRDGQILGTPGDDSLTHLANGASTIIGLAGNDRLFGSPFSDSMTGDEGNDTILGGAGGDRIADGSGNDTVFGGDGNDTFIAGDGADRYDGGAGNDRVDYTGSPTGVDVNLRSSGRGGFAEGDSYAGVEDAIGSNFADRIAGTDGDNTISGMAGDDSVSGLGGNDFLRGFSGNDRIFGDGGNDLIFADDGDDTLFGGSENDRLFGDAGNDTLFGGDGIDTLEGGDGDDLLSGGSGPDSLSGGRGFDTVSYEGSSTGGVNVDLSAANRAFLNDAHGDVLSSIEGLIGSVFQDFLTGNAGDNRLVGRGGDDGIIGLEGNDTLLGEDGNDSLSGRIGDDSLFGGAGNDSLAGEDGNDSLDGGTGNDVLSGGTGLNRLAGGAGDDLYIVTVATDAVIEAIGEGLDTVEATVSYVLSDHVERLVLQGTADLNGTGSSTNNWIFGTSGRNTLLGGAGNDWLMGAEGDDILNGQAGADSLVGGLGNDQYFVDDAGDIIMELPGEGLDTVRSTAATYTLARGIEIFRLIGTGNIAGTGSADAEEIFGNAGANVIDGAGGDDTLRGSGGNDTLLGGFGRDLLVGGAGSDVFAFRAPGESGVGPTLRDTIQDFQAGRDRIDLSAIDADGALAGDQAFTFIGTAGFTGGTGAGLVRFVALASGSGSIVQIDVTGNGQTDMQILVQGTAILQAADFIL